MIRAFIRFYKGLRSMPIYAQAWLMLLMVANLVVPLFFLGRLEAQVTAATLLVSGMLMVVLTAVSGFSRLLGAGHFLWFPLLVFLWVRLDENPAGDFFGLWIRALMILNAISLVIDVTDVVRYIAGDRDEI